MISFRKRLSLSGTLRPSDAPRIPVREAVMPLDQLAVRLAPANDLIVIAGSAGGVDALRVVLAALPPDFSASIAIVLHRTAAHRHLLRDLLGSWISLPVRDAVDGDVISASTVYIAPPDVHCTVSGDRTIALVAGGPIHHVLSSADPLFASAALAFGDRLTAVVLTGGDGDGSAGVRSVKLEGGTVIVQEPGSAVNGGMPRSAIATGAVDFVLPLEEIAEALVARVRASTTSGRERPVGTP